MRQYILSSAETITSKILIKLIDFLGIVNQQTWQILSFLIGETITYGCGLASATQEEGCKETKSGTEALGISKKNC